MRLLLIGAPGHERPAVIAAESGAPVPTEPIIFMKDPGCVVEPDDVYYPPGDLICTGTPPGVGMGQHPPRYLHPGDTMRLGITRLGEQRQRVVPAPADALS